MAALEVVHDPLEAGVVVTGAAVVVGETQAQLLLAAAVEDDVELLLGELADGGVDAEAVLLGDGLEEALVPGLTTARLGEWLHGALGDGPGAVGDDEGGVDLHLDAETGAARAGAVGAVEAEGAGLDLAEREAVVWAGEVLAEDALRDILLAGAGGGGHVHDALPGGERRLDRFGEAQARAFAFAGFGNDDAVDDDIDVVALVLVELDGLVEIAHLAVDADAHEALTTGLVEHPDVLALLRAGEGSEEEEAGAGRVGEGCINDLLDGLALDGTAAGGAVRSPDACPEKAHVVVDLGDGAHRRAGVVGSGFLIDRDGGGEAVDVVDVGLLHEAKELASVGGEGLDVAALTLGVDGVEGEGGLARTGEARNHDELVARDLDIDVLEVVLAGAAHGDVVEGHAASILAARPQEAGCREQRKTRQCGPKAGRRVRVSRR